MSVTSIHSDDVNNPRELPVVVYSAESSVRQPLKLIRQIVADLWQYRELTWTLFTRDLKAQFRQSLLGYVWLFVPILATTLVWMFLASMRVVQVEDTPVPYPAYVLLGSMIWGVLAASVSQPLTSFHESQSVFMRLKVPPEAFILSGIGKVVFEMLIKLIVVIPALAMMGILPASTAWLFPIGMACAIVVGISLGFLLLPIGSLYSDVGRGIATLMSFGMYLAPVVYPPPQAGWTATVINWNPLTPIVMTCRDWLVVGPSEYTTALVATTAAAMLLLCLGLVVLRVVLPHLVERMGM